jgi:hypothetical protein
LPVPAQELRKKTSISVLQNVRKSDGSWLGPEAFLRISGRFSFAFS